MERIWQSQYPKSVPTTIDFNQYDSLVGLLSESFKTYADQKAYICMDRPMTFGELDVLSRNLAAWLQAQGLRKGDRVAIMLPNILQFPVALAAVLRAGLIAVNVNPLYTARELEHQLKDSGAVAIIVLENFAKTLQEALPGTDIRHILIASIGDLLGLAKGAMVNFFVRRSMVPAYHLPTAIPFSKALSMGAKSTFTPVETHRDDIAILQYTGGTTGLSKGAILTHGAIIAAVLASEAWIQPVLEGKKFENTPAIAICALPLYHVFALVSCALIAMRTGGLCVLIPNARDIPALVKEMGKYRFNLLPGVNTLFNALLNNPDFANLDFSGLLFSLGGGMAIQEVVARKWLEVTGSPIVEGYGLSETCSGVTCNPVNNVNFTGTIGLPLPGVDIKIIDEEGKEVKQGEAGEIAIRSPLVMAGYWNRPDETAGVMTSDGYFKSGDIGVMDDKGFIRIVDRKKDMILVSGFNVYPNEIEAVVAEHPGVLECAVVGLPGGEAGETVALYIVRKDPNLTKEDIAAFCKTQLTGYKTPRIIEFRDELPKTNVGKILRRELRDEALREKAQGH